MMHASKPQILSARLLFMLLASAAACDPVPTNSFVPPGGFVVKTDVTGQSAVRAVLVTPSHGSFLTVREALRAYVGRTDSDIKVEGWYAEESTSEVMQYYSVAFLWHDGDGRRKATWQLNQFGVWPSNEEARVFSMFPPTDR